MIFVGVDWAEAHHDVCVLDGGGKVLGRKRVADSLGGVRELHALVASHLGDDDDVSHEVVVGIEKDRGLIVRALVAANYQVYAVNPMAAARYRERHHVSGAKSDPGDAKMLADLVRTDRHNHREVAGDTNLAEAVKLLARAHPNAIWSRQRQLNALRSSLRDYFPSALLAFGTDLDSVDATAVLAIAPTPALARMLSRAKIESALRRGGRKRNIEKHAEKIQAALREEQLTQPPILENAYGIATKVTIAVIVSTNHAIAELEASMSEHFEQHPSAKIIHSLPGMGTVLGARVLGEFGDDPNRYSDAKSRKKLRRHVAGHQDVGKIARRARALQPQQATRGRPRPVGLLLNELVTGRQGLLRRT